MKHRKRTNLIHIVGYPGAGKTTAMVKLAKRIKKLKGKEIRLHSGNTKRDFKKQQIPVLVTPDHSMAWVGKDPSTMQSHRKRLAGTESLGIFQRNMVHRTMEALVDEGYQNIIIDGFCMLKPAPQQTLRRLQKRGKMKYHVFHLSTPFDVAAESWWTREREAAAQGHTNAAKALVKNSGRCEKTKQKLNDKLNVFFELADEITETTRDSIVGEVESLI